MSCLMMNLTFFLEEKRRKKENFGRIIFVFMQSHAHLQATFN